MDGKTTYFGGKFATKFKHLLYTWKIVVIYHVDAGILLTYWLSWFAGECVFWSGITKSLYSIFAQWCCIKNSLIIFQVISLNSYIQSRRWPFILSFVKWFHKLALRFIWWGKLSVGKEEKVHSLALTPASDPTCNNFPERQGGKRIHYWR